jgi:biopolymer transport protein ExbD
VFRVRRQKHEPRIELAPLIDVMLFLLTFFIYQVMVTERVDLIPMELRAYRSGTAAKPAAAATISIDLTGRLSLDRVPVALDEIVAKLEVMRATSPDLVVYLALADGASRVDRSALLLDIWDRLQPAKFNVSIVGRRNSGPESVPADPKTPSATSTAPSATPTAPPATTTAPSATPTATSTSPTVTPGT